MDPSERGERVERRVSEEKTKRSHFFFKKKHRRVVGTFARDVDEKDKNSLLTYFHNFTTHRTLQKTPIILEAMTDLGEVGARSSAQVGV